MSPPPRETLHPHSPTGDGVTEIDTSFCSSSVRNRCGNGYHTRACAKRRALGKDVLTWLGDEAEESHRARFEKELKELTSADMMLLFMKWRAERNIGFLGVSEALSNMHINRTVPEIGDFWEVLLQTEAVRRKIVQDYLDDPRQWPGVDHE